MFRKKPLPLDGSCQAEYADGYVLDETQHNDVSQHTIIQMVDGVPTGANIFDDILHKRPEAEHGPMVRFTLFYKDRKWDIDWRDLPASARPVRFRDFERTDQELEDGRMVEGQKRLMRMRFGYQFTDKNGKNQQIIQEVE